MASMGKPTKYALLDDDDFDRVYEFATWYVHRDKKAAKRGEEKYYAVARLKSGGHKRIFQKMNRFVLGIGDPTKKVIHLNGDKLDCRKENLKVCLAGCIPRRRRKNKTGYRGVEINGNKWRARLLHEGKRCYLGTFYNKQDAARAYDAKALEIYGRLAILNFPEERIRRHEK